MTRTELRSAFEASIDMTAERSLVDYSPRRNRGGWMVRFIDEAGSKIAERFESKSDAWRYLINVWGL